MCGRATRDPRHVSCLPPDPESAVPTMNAPTSNVNEIGETLAHRASKAASSAVDSLERQAPVVGAHVREALESGKARASEWTARVQNGIRHDPVRSLLIAAAAGAVLGLIIGRRSR